MQSDVMQCPVMSCEDAMYRHLLQRMSSRCTVMWCDVWCELCYMICNVRWRCNVWLSRVCCDVVMWWDVLWFCDVVMWCDVMCCELLRNVCCNVMWCAMHEQQEAGGRRKEGRKEEKDGVPKGNKNPNRKIWGVMWYVMWRCNVMQCVSSRRREEGGRKEEQDAVRQENKNPNRTIWGIRTPIERYGEMLCDMWCNVKM